MATVWTYGGYLCHASKVTSSRKEGSLPAKLDKVGDVTTNQKFYEVNSRIISLNSELKKTLEAMTRLRTHADQYESIVKEKSQKAKLAKKYINGSDLTNEEVKKVSSMSKDEIKRYGAAYYNEGTNTRVELGPVNSIHKILNTMKSEYESAYKKYQKIATLSSKLSSMMPVSQTAAASSYGIMRDIHDIVFESINHWAAVVSDELFWMDGVKYANMWRDWLRDMPKPAAL